jgi:hypothetical protein
MVAELTASAIARWRRDPAAFIEQHLYDPITRKPFKLLPAEREFLKHAFQFDVDGRLKYPEMTYGAIKKSGKTGFAAIFVITLLLLYGERFAEAYCCANDLEQAESRVYEMIRRIVDASPLLNGAHRITADRITFPATGAVIRALASDFASAAGGHPTIAVLDELWGFSSERARRLFDELVPVPTRKISCRLVVSHAGFESEGELLHEIYQRGLQLPLAGTDLRAGNGQLFFWSHVPIAPWQTEQWLAEMRRTCRPNQYLRMFENRFVGAADNLFDMGQWDACVMPSLAPVPPDRTLPIWIGIDASTKRDSTALVAVTFDKKAQCARLVQHRVFVPNEDSPIDFAVIEAIVLEWAKQYRLMKAMFDPFQFVGSAQRLAKAGVEVEEYPQSLGNLTAATNNLLDLVRERRLVLYLDAAMRLAVSRTVIVESARGLRIDKLKAGHHIDVVAALSMACLAAVRGQSESSYRIDGPWIDDDEEERPKRPGWMHAGFASEADAEAYIARMRAQTPNIQFPWHGHSW